VLECASGGIGHDKRLEITGNNMIVERKDVNLFETSDYVVSAGSNSVL